MSRVDAIVVAGGRASRMGGIDKLSLQVAGAALLDRALAAVEHADAVVVVGPTRATAVPVIWTRETPTGSGPVAAIGAGLRALKDASGDAAQQRVSGQEQNVTLILAGDMPLVHGSFSSLVEELTSGPWDVAVGVDDHGFDQPLLAAWRTEALVGALERLPVLAGARVRDLLTDVRVSRVRVGVAALDCDAEADFNRATEILGETRY